MLCFYLRAQRDKNRTDLTFEPISLTFISLGLAALREDRSVTAADTVKGFCCVTAKIIFAFFSFKERQSLCRELCREKMARLESRLQPSERIQGRECIFTGCHSVVNLFLECFLK